MKKVLTIQLGNQTFKIEEEAYDFLKSYLQQVSRNQTIPENELSRLIRDQLSVDDELVVLEMVKKAISQLGTDVQSGFSSFSNSQSSEPNYYNRSDRRLYRDSKNRVFGGVCSGLGYYYKTNLVLFRILFVVLFFITSGGFFLAYIIMWAALPKANTVGKRAHMTGVDYQPDVEPVAPNTPVADKKGFIWVMKKITGIFFMIAGVSAIVGLSIAGTMAFNFQSVLPSMLPASFNNAIPVFGLNTSMLLTLIVSGLVMVGIPFLLLFFVGTKMVFEYVSDSRMILLTSLGVWVVAIALATSTGFRMFGVMKDTASIHIDNPISISNADTLYLVLDKLKANQSITSTFQYNQIKVVKTNHGDQILASPKLKIEKSETAEAIVKYNKSAKGNGIEEADKNAEMIQYSYILNQNQIKFDPYFSISDSKRWRSQELVVQLLLPENAVFFLDESMLPILTDMENKSNMWVSDMVNHYWKVTPSGLEQVERKK